MDKNKINTLLHENCLQILLQSEPRHGIKDIRENIDLYKSLIKTTTDLYVAIVEKKDLEYISRLIQEKRNLTEKYQKITNNIWRL